MESGGRIDPRSGPSYYQNYLEATLSQQPGKGESTYEAATWTLTGMGLPGKLVAKCFE